MADSKPVRKFKVNEGSHQGPDEKGKTQTWTQGQIVTTTQDLSKLGPKFSEIGPDGKPLTPNFGQPARDI